MTKESDQSNKESCGVVCRHRRALDVKALVAFDYAQPALWLGVALIGGGVFLYNLRNVQPVSSKDSDIVLSCILVFSGGILIFQVFPDFAAHRNIDFGLATPAGHGLASVTLRLC